MSPVGFSKVVAELASKKPPPFVPSCLMDSMKPIGPRAMVWVTPFRRRGSERAGQVSTAP